MAISVKHKFQSAKADSADSSIVRPSNWNDEHDLTMATNRLLGRTTAGTGPAQEISLGSNMEFVGTSISVKTDAFQSPLGYTPVNKAGDTMSETLTIQKLSAAFWAGLRIHNTGANDAALQIAAGNRGFTGNQIEFGQRNANGAGYIWVAGKQWVMDPTGNMALPNSGVLYGDGNTYLASGGLNTTLTTVLSRMRQVRLGPFGAQNVNRNGWNYAPSGAVITGMFKDNNGEIQNMEYRNIQTTDLFGNWANVTAV